MNNINANLCLINGSTFYRQYFLTVERTWVIKKVGIWSVLVYIEQIFFKSIWTLPVWIIGEERMLEHWKCKQKVDTNPKKCLLCVRIHGRYFKLSFKHFKDWGWRWRESLRALEYVAIRTQAPWGQGFCFSLFFSQHPYQFVVQSMSSEYNCW